MSHSLPGYRILQLIGRGARSRISLAVELATGREVAVKHVVRRSAEDDPILQQMEIEYTVSGRVNHPNLRHSHDLHRVRKLWQVKELWLVMEYVDGLDLAQARPNRLNTFLIIVRKVAAGLLALHESGYVHADIKPINILIGRRGLVKIIDFGQSCAIGHRKTRIQGTPDYIAPEQVLRLPLDPRTDIFNFGATLYWVLTSETYPTALPRTDTSGRTNLAAPAPPVAPRELNAKIPLSLSKLVMECCRENPRERPADMKEVGARLIAVHRRWRKHCAARAAQPDDATRSAKEEA